VVIDWSS